MISESPSAPMPPLGWNPFNANSYGSGPASMTPYGSSASGFPMPAQPGDLPTAAVPTSQAPRLTSLPTPVSPTNSDPLPMPGGVDATTRATSITSPRSLLPSVSGHSISPSIPTPDTIPRSTVSQETIPQPEFSQSATSVSQDPIPQTTVPKRLVPQETAPQPTVPQPTVPQTTTPQTAAPPDSAPQITTPQTTASPDSVPVPPPPPDSVPVPPPPPDSVPPPPAPQTAVPVSTTPQTTISQTSVLPQTASPLNSRWRRVWKIGPSGSRSEGASR